MVACECCHLVDKLQVLVLSLVSIQCTPGCCHPVDTKDVSCERADVIIVCMFIMLQNLKVLTIIVMA